jgi:DNA-binding response OmpR family regulator
MPSTTLPELSSQARHARCTPSRLLVVDDVTGIRCLVADCLREAGHIVFEAADIATARQHLATQQLDLLISDASLPDGSGIALARSARGARPELKVVMISGRPTALGNFDAVLLKPFDLEELVRLVGSLLDAVTVAAS